VTLTDKKEDLPERGYQLDALWQYSGAPIKAHVKLNEEKMADFGNKTKWCHIAIAIPDER
jgi:hypothetical protein